MLYFDFKKHNDLDHNYDLFMMFAVIGLTPNLLKFFSKYFCIRLQYVQLLGFRSDPYLTLSGQGSILEPTLFLIMIYRVLLGWL